MPAELAVPFKQARNYHQGRAAKPIWIVIHDAVTLEVHDAAESVQNYFAGPGAPVASAHLSADDNSLVRSVHDWDTAFGAPGVNAAGFHLEQAGKNQNRAGWTDSYSKKMITEQSAKAVAYWSVHHGIPLLRRGPHDVLAGRGGVIGHIDASKAFGTPGGHTDPDGGLPAGQGYPYDLLIGAAREHSVDVKKPVIVHNPYQLPLFNSVQRPFSVGAVGNRVRFVQWALGVPVDGSFGPQTAAAVKAFQHKHRLHIDGVVGPQTAAALAVVTHTH